MSKLLYLLALLSLATSNIYLANCLSYTTLNATVLNQMGYNNSYSISNLEYIDPNTFSGYNSLYQLL